MPLPLTDTCFSKIQTGFAFLVPAYLGSPGKGSLNGCVCAVANNNNNNINNSHDNVYGAVIMTKVIARVHPVHLMNVD